MRRSIFARAASVILAASLCAGFAGCGGSESSSGAGSTESPAESTPPAAEESAPGESAAEESSEITGTAQTWGVFTVLVPEGWTLRKGDVFDENSPDYCSVKKSDFSYFDFKNEKEETQKQQYEYNHKTYTQDQKDLPASTIAGIEWNGFEYGSSFVPGFELYAKAGDKFIRVSCAGFRFDSPEARAILESLKIS